VGVVQGKSEGQDTCRGNRNGGLDDEGNNRRNSTSQKEKPQRGFGNLRMAEKACQLGFNNDLRMRDDLRNKLEGMGSASHALHRKSHADTSHNYPHTTFFRIWKVVNEMKSWEFGLTHSLSQQQR